MLLREFESWLLSRDPRLQRVGAGDEEGAPKTRRMVFWSSPDGPAKFVGVPVTEDNLVENPELTMRLLEREGCFDN